MYTVHAEDRLGCMALARLYTKLSQLLGDDAENLLEKHLWLDPVTEGRPASVETDAVGILTSATLFYPSRYLRVVTLTNANRERFEPHISEWLRPAKRLIFINPRADTERMDPKDKRNNCFDMALLNAHAAFGGYKPPKKKRPHYVSGRKSRLGKPYFAQQ